MWLLHWVAHSCFLHFSRQSDSLKRCFGASQSLCPLKTTVNPLTDGQHPVGISSLSAKRQFNELVSMPVDTRSYDGVVNFNYQPVDTENDKMSVAFTVQEEGSEVLLGNVMAFHD